MEDYTAWTMEKLRRKADQAWDLAGLARADGDEVDEKRRTEEARAIQEEIGRRTRDHL